MKFEKALAFLRLGKILRYSDGTLYRIKNNTLESIYEIEGYLDILTEWHETCLLSHHILNTNWEVVDENERKD